MRSAIMLVGAKKMSRKARKFKYAKKLARYNDCPPPDCEPYVGTAFRFVNHPIVAKDFETQADKSPHKRRYQCCKGHALSLYTTEEMAKAEFARYSAISEMFVKMTGGFIASGAIDETHGVAGPINDETGHFSLFEWEGVDLEPLFTVVGPANA